MSTAPKYKSCSGEIVTGYLIVLLLLGAVGYIFFKPSTAQKEAKASAVATQHVDDATKAQSAAAAGSVAAIQQVNAQAPESPQKAAIAREIPTVLAKLEPPDLKAENEALARMNAVMQGKLELASSLYEKEAKLTREQAAEIADAKAERKKVDDKLAEMAAVGKFKDQVIMVIGGLLAVVAAVAGYLKLYHVSPNVMGTILADIRAGTTPSQAFSDALAPRHYSPVQRAARLATPSVDVPNQAGP